MGYSRSFLHGYFSLKMVLMFIHVYAWYSGFHSNWCRGIRPYLEWMGKLVIGVFGIVARPTRVPIKFQYETSLLLRYDRNVGIPFQTKQGNLPSSQDERGKGASSWGMTGMLGFLSRQSRGIYPHLEMRKGKGAQIEVCRETLFLSSRAEYVGELLELYKEWRVQFRVSWGTVGFLLRHCSGKGPHLTLRGESSGFLWGLVGSLGFLSNCGVDLRVLLV